MRKSRITWADLPEAVTSWAETQLGSAVIEWHSQPGGWSPGTADRLVTAGGSGAFLKAAHPSLNDMTPRLHRDEIRATRLLGPDVPCAHLRASYDDGEWVALLFEDIDGRHPRSPWRENELRAVLDALSDVAVATAHAPLNGLPLAQEVYAEDFARFDELSREDLQGVDPWLAGRVDELAACGRRAGEAVGGDCLGHGDLRADNILVQHDGRVRIIDWPNACRSAPWVDGVLLAVNIEVLGGLRDVDGRIVDHLPLLRDWAATLGARHDDVLDVLVGMLAYYTWASRQAEVPGLPTLRRDQGIAGKAALRVVKRLWPTVS